MAYTDSILRGTDPSFTTTANEANPLIAPEISRSIIQGAIAKSMVMALVPPLRMKAHQKVLPVLTELPQAFWVGEVTGPNTGLKQTTSAAWRNVVITAAELAANIIIPDSVRADTDVDLWAQLKPLMEQAIGKAVDEAVLFGLNKPAEWTAADLTTGATAAGNVVTDGTSTVDVADDINNLFAAVEADGYSVNGIAMRMKFKAQLRGLRDSQKGPIFQAGMPGLTGATFGSTAASETGEVLGVKAVIGKNGAFESHDTAAATATNMIVGDWSQCYLAIREDIGFSFSNSAVLTDAAGAIQYNAWQQDSTVMRVTFRAGFAVPNPINAIQPTQASRYPFAVMKMAA